MRICSVLSSKFRVCLNLGVSLLIQVKTISKRLRLIFNRVDSESAHHSIKERGWTYVGMGDDNARHWVLIRVAP